MKKQKYAKTHMSIPWHDYSTGVKCETSRNASLREKASVIGRAGMIMLSCGTTAWRVRKVMVKISEALGVTCVADIGITTINFTCYEGKDIYTQSLSTAGVGVNINKLRRMENYAADFASNGADISINDNHNILDRINDTPKLYSSALLSLAVAVACAAFAFNLGAGLAEIVCVFFAAGIGNLVKSLLDRKQLSFFIGISAGAAVSCGAYALMLFAAEHMLQIPAPNGTGYIGAVLYLVPGFPFITCVLDFAKLDMRSAIERLAYSVIVMAVATAFTCVAAYFLGFDPAISGGLKPGPALTIILQSVASFAAVIGLSMVFNSLPRVACAAAIVGMIANTSRLVLIELAGVPIICAAFIGSFLAGILAWVVVKVTKFPRIGITIPAVVISFPGLLMYRAIYYMGTGSTADGLVALIKAIGVIFAIALGVIFARFITDREFRHRD